jgi:hypothetical protein
MLAPGSFLLSKKGPARQHPSHLAERQGPTMGKYGKHFASKGAPPRTVALRLYPWQAENPARGG